MPDIWLVWFHLDRNSIIGTRDDVRKLTVELDLPLSALQRDTKTKAFRTACKTTTTVQIAGKRRSLHAKVTKQTSEFETWHLQLGDEPIAEWKFFQSRRTRAGIVPGTHVLRFLIKKQATPQVRQAAQTWHTKANALYEELSVEAPHGAIRLQARATMFQYATPVLGRDSMYFAYDDDMDGVAKVETFLARTMADSPVFRIGVDDSPQPVLADSADEHMSTLLSPLLDQLHNALQPGARGVHAERYDRYIQQLSQARRTFARHERRLSLKLPKTRASLLVADQMMHDIPIPARLPRVIR